MTAGDLVLVVAVVLCALAFAALVVALVHVRSTLADVRSDLREADERNGRAVEALQAAAVEARDAAAGAREDLARFDRLLGSAEAISRVVTPGSGRVGRVALSAPAIRAAGLATGTSRAVRRLRRGA